MDLVEQAGQGNGFDRDHRDRLLVPESLLGEMACACQVSDWKVLGIDCLRFRPSCRSPRLSVDQCVCVDRGGRDSSVYLSAWSSARLGREMASKFRDA